MGFVVTQTGNYRWIYRVLAIINGVQFLFALFLQPETLYIRKGVQHVGSAFKQEYLTFGRLDPKPLKMYEFIQPLSLFKYPSILIPTIAYSMVFGFCSVLLTVEIPQLFIPKFGFNAQQIGLQFLGIIIGSLIGEQIGGRLSDFWMHRKAKQMAYHAPPPPEHRLWLSYFGFVLAMVGLIVFGVRFQQLPAHQYDVSPIVGIAISAVGNQIVTTVSTTYAIDCHFEHSASIGIFINVIRSTWAFIGKSLLQLRREKESTHPYPIPIPSHCEGTHTKSFTTCFFSSAGDGTKQQVLFLTTYNRSLLVSQHVILARRIRFRRTDGGSDFPFQHHPHGNCAMERKAMEKKHTRKNFESSCPIPIIIIGTCCCCCCGEGFYHEK